MTDCRFSRLLAKLEIPLLLAVPAVMAAALLAGVEQAALAMLVVVALVLALFFAGYEASRPGLRQIMPTLVLAVLAAAMAVGAVAPLILQRNGKKGRGAKARARRKRR